MMRIAISVVIAFLLSGIAQVVQDLGNPSIVERPLWVSYPTFAKAVFCALAWFTRPFEKPIYVGMRKSRAFALGMLDLILQVGVATLFIWLCISLSIHLFSLAILRVTSAVVFIGVGGLILLPLGALITLPVKFILMFPLDLVFPNRAEPNAEYWCNKGLDLDSKGHHEKAIRCFGKALRLEPDHFTAWCGKGSSEWALNRRTEAARSYQQFLALAPAQQTNPQLAQLIESCQQRLRELEHK